MSSTTDDAPHTHLLDKFRLFIHNFTTIEGLSPCLLLDNTTWLLAYHIHKFTFLVLIFKHTEKVGSSSRNSSKLSKLIMDEKSFHILKSRFHTYTIYCFNLCSTLLKHSLVCRFLFNMIIL